MKEICFKKYHPLHKDFKIEDIDKDKAFELFLGYYDVSYGSVSVDDNLMEIHTGGWSDNEYLISKFKESWWWSQNIVCSMSGGHYYFDMDKLNNDKHHWDIVKRKA